MSSHDVLHRLWALTVVSMGLAISSTPVQAQVAYVYDARELKGTAVVPETPSPGYATAQGTFSVGEYWCTDSPDHVLNFATLYIDLSGPPTGCYLHRGAAGVNGERLYTLYDGFFPPNWSYTTVTIDPADCADLDAQNIYIVITTDLYPEGEIRGQIGPMQLGPVESTTWGNIKSVYR